MEPKTRVLIMQQRLSTQVTWLGRKAALSYVLLITLVMIGTGLIALHEGATRFMLPFIIDDSSSYTQQLIEQARAAPSKESLEALSSELALLGRATSLERFTESKIPDQGAYYVTMPQRNQLLLVSHVLLGVFCLVVGLPVLASVPQAIHEGTSCLWRPLCGDRPDLRGAGADLYGLYPPTQHLCTPDSLVLVVDFWPVVHRRHCHGYASTAGKAHP